MASEARLLLDTLRGEVEQLERGELARFRTEPLQAAPKILAYAVVIDLIDGHIRRLAVPKHDCTYTSDPRGWAGQ